MKFRAGVLGLVLLAVSLALVASGSTLAQAETRVRASTFSTAVGVSDFGPSAAFSQLRNGQSYDETASVPVLAAEGVGAESGALRIFASEGRAAAAERAGALNPGASGELFATNGQYEFGNIAQSNLAISARGANVAGYWEVPAQYASKFSYVGRVQPTLLWEGGGREFTWAGSIPFEDLGPFQQIPWAAGQ